MYLLLQTGVVSYSASLALLEALVLFVAAVVLLDEDGSSAALLESFLLVVGPELGLDQDGRLSHLLVERVLRTHSDSVSGAVCRQTSQVIRTVCREYVWRAGMGTPHPSPVQPGTHHPVTSWSRDIGCFQLLHLL